MEINRVIEGLTELKAKETDANNRVTLEESIKIANHFNKIIDGYKKIIAQNIDLLRERYANGITFETEFLMALVCDEVDYFCTDELRDWLCEYFTEITVRDNKENRLEESNRRLKDMFKEMEEKYKDD